jgi:hypothetical protein
METTNKPYGSVSDHLANERTFLAFRLALRFYCRRDRSQPAALILFTS